MLTGAVTIVPSWAGCAAQVKMGRGMGTGPGDPQMLPEKHICEQTPILMPPRTPTHLTTGIEAGTLLSDAKEAECVANIM